MIAPAARVACRWVTAAALGVGLAVAPPAMGQGPADVLGAPVGLQAGDGPVGVRADEVTYDRELETVTARGNVEITQGQSSLFADTVSYAINIDRMTASGNVALAGPDGSVAFAQFMEVTGDLKQATVRRLQLLLADRSRLGADALVRTGAGTNQLENVVYTACDPCKDDPTRAPIWQVKAVRVIQDEARQNIIYRDAWIEVYGIPVAYTPYLEHPEPSVRRRTGFLAPTVGGTNNLGGSVTIPYYWVTSPQSDVTLAPLFTTDEGPVAAAEYRQTYRAGRLVSEGSITQDSRDKIRGHVFVDATADLSPEWRSGVQIEQSSDSTYLDRYGFRTEPWLTSRVHAEGFDGDRYALVEGYVFQELREDVSNDFTPVVAPLVELEWLSEPGPVGSRWRATASGVAVARDRGSESRRASLELGWHLPYTSPSGQVWDLNLTARGDGYDVDDVERDDGTIFNGQVGRFYPQASMQWRWPFMRAGRQTTEVIEPIAQVIAAPSGGNPERIPNNDSRDLEFDDTNLFSRSRFVGYDRVEPGTRINYGLRWALFGRQGQLVQTFLGQSYRFDEDDLFPEESGLDGGLSDVVGRVYVSPGPNLDVIYGFRLQRDGLDPRRHEVLAQIGPPSLRLTADYTFLNASTTEFTSFGDRHEIGTGASAALSRFWSARFDTRHRLTEEGLLTEGGGPLTIGGGLRYEDECFIFDFEGAYDYTDDRDDEGGLAVFLRIGLKTLGEVQTGGELE